MDSEGSWEDLGHKRSNHAVPIGRPNTNGNKGKHIQAMIDERHPTAGKERPSPPEHYRGRENQLDPGEQARREGMLHGLARQHFRHYQPQQRYREDETDPEPTSYIDQFGVDLLLHAHCAWLQRHATDRTGTWLRAD